MAMTKEEIERERESIEHAANLRIISESKEWHPLEYRARVEMIAAEVIPPRWEWTVRENIGAVPILMLTGYDPRLAK
jgi:hypothetical protein